MNITEVIDEVIYIVTAIFIAWVIARDKKILHSENVHQIHITLTKLVKQNQITYQLSD